MFKGVEALCLRVHDQVIVSNNPVNWIDPLGLQGFDPGPNTPAPPGERDPRTPWLPPNLAKRSKNCPPYYMMSGRTMIPGGEQESIWKGVLPLVDEKEEPISKCKSKITCIYSGIINLGLDWKNHKNVHFFTRKTLTFIINK